MRREGVDLGGAAVIALTETEEDARLGGRELGVGRHDGIESERGGFQFLAVGFEEAEEIEPEVGKGEIGERDGILVEILEVENLVLQAFELIIPVVEIGGDIATGRDPG